MAKEEPKPIPPIEHPKIVTFDTDPYYPQSPFKFPPPSGQGLFEMSAEQYFALPLPDYSFYKAFAQSPQHGLAFLRQRREEITPLKKKNFDFGHALHWLMLEPELFAKNIVIDPGLNKNSNDYKAWAETVPADCVALSKDQIDSAMRMRDRAMRKDTIRRLLGESGISEVSGIFDDINFPIWHKIRVDKLVDGVVVDYKTSASASSYGFQKAIFQYKYNWQATIYLHGVSRVTGYPHKKFVWIVQEKEDPWECRAILADPAEVREAEIHIEEQIERLSECIQSGYWPGYPDAGLDEIMPTFENNFDNIEYDEEIGI